MRIFFWSLDCSIRLPGHILTDKGRQFVSKRFGTLWDFLKQNHVTTIAYHPQKIEQVQRYNNAIVAHLRPYVVEHRDSRVHSSSRWTTWITPRSFAPRAFSILFFTVEKSAWSDKIWIFVRDTFVFIWEQITPQTVYSPLADTGLYERKR